MYQTWVLLRAVVRFKAVFIYAFMVFVLARLCYLLPGYRTFSRRLRFARYFYFIAAKIAANAHIHLEFEEVVDRPCLYVSNHVSWMDILSIFKVYSVRFVSKVEVRRWPLFGFLARWVDTLFIHRGKGGREMIRQVTRALAHSSVFLFPEGTSTIGHHVHRFLPPVFRASCEAGVDVVPVSLYYRCRGLPSTELGVSYTGDESLAASVWRTVRFDRVDIYIKAHRPISCVGKTPAQVSQQAHAIVERNLQDLRQRYPIV